MIGLACLGFTLALGIPAAYTRRKKQSALHAHSEELLRRLAVLGLATALALIIRLRRLYRLGEAGSSPRSAMWIYTLPFMIRSAVAAASLINLNLVWRRRASLGASLSLKLLFPYRHPHASARCILAGSRGFTLPSVNSISDVDAPHP